MADAHGIIVPHVELLVSTLLVLGSRRNPELNLACVMKLATYRNNEGYRVANF